MKTFNAKKLIQKLSSLGTRQGANEAKALILIARELQLLKTSFKLQKFITSYPKYLKCKLFVDGRQLPAEPVSFVSGTINNPIRLLNSLESSIENKFTSNINSNPDSQTISRPNHYFAPAFAVRYFDFKKIKNTSTIKGVVNVRRTRHASANILIGNIKNPQTIIFSHYDSIGPGAIDNASGVAASLQLINDKHSILDKNLFVIAGNEELSYDKETYWGHGYRVFEKTYHHLLKSCRQILVADCLGYAETKIYRDPQFIKLGLPIKNIHHYIKKTAIVSGPYKALMPFYHSHLDKPSLIKQCFLKEAYQTLLALIE